MTNFLTSLDKSRIRNEQAGDWRYDSDHIWAMSAKMSDRRSELAVQIHELIECFLCREAGITDAEVTAFDQMFEEEREKGLHDEFAEDGDDPRAPYAQQHFEATEVEKAVCKALQLPWEHHEANVQELFKHA
jgi:hypothetical protein